VANDHPALLDRVEAEKNCDDSINQDDMGLGQMNLF
jgi:hypothetical protein